MKAGECKTSVSRRTCLHVKCLLVNPLPFMVFFGGVSQQKFLSLGPKSELAKIHLYLCGLTLVYTPEIYPFSPDKP